MPPRRIRLSAYATEGAAWTQKRSFGEPRISRLAKRLAGRSGSVRRSSLRRGGQRGADRGERGVGRGAEGGDGTNADHDDQGQHDRILDRRRAVFTLHKVNDEIAKLTHVPLRLVRENWIQRVPFQPRNAAANLSRQEGRSLQLRGAWTARSKIVRLMPGRPL